MGAVTRALVRLRCWLGCHEAAGWTIRRRHVWADRERVELHATVSVARGTCARCGAVLRHTHRMIYGDGRWNR